MEKQVLVRGFLNKSQAEQFKGNKEFKFIPTKAIPDNLNGGRYMLVRTDGKTEPLKNYPGEWGEGMPLGINISKFFSGVWDYSQWDSDKEKQVLTFFSEGVPIFQYSKITGEFKFTCPSVKKML